VLHAGKPHGLLILDQYCYEIFLWLPGQVWFDEVSEVDD